MTRLDGTISIRSRCRRHRRSPQEYQALMQDQQKAIAAAMADAEGNTSKDRSSPVRARPRSCSTSPGCRTPNACSSLPDHDHRRRLPEWRRHPVRSSVPLRLPPNKRERRDRVRLLPPAPIREFPAVFASAPRSASNLAMAFEVPNRQDRPHPDAAIKSSRKSCQFRPHRSARGLRGGLDPRAAATAAR